MIIPIVLALLAGRYVSSSEGFKIIQDDAMWIVAHAQQMLTPEFVTMVAAVLGSLALVCFAFVMVVNSKYRSMVKGNTVDLDPWVQQPEGPTFGNRAKLVFTHWMSAGSIKARNEAVALGEQPSTFMLGLRVSVKEGEAGSVPHSLTSKAPSGPSPIVVGTIRMGFGHHRIAYSTCSWSLASNKGATYFHDLLGIDSPEAQLIKDMDKWYSKGSRLASEMGGMVEQMWGSLTLSGDANMLRSTYQMGEMVKPLLMGLPRDTPIIATHCLVALCAVACGFTNVINLVIDNYAQWFIVVPGALNLVQGPTNYHNLLKMGVPPKELRLVGAWIPKDLVDNLKPDCTARIERAQKGGKPLRLLLPVGGAGAQRKFVSSLIKALGPRLQKGEVQLFLNAGDHEHMRAAFIEALDAIKHTYAVVDTMEGVNTFCDTLRKGQEPASAVTLFAFKDYFPAVAATDILSRVTDVLACKPSELAFYPVPKLMIRRVGDHEAHSALRASELGDGTLEAREVEDALRYIELFKDLPGSPMLVSMNEMIMQNGEQGIYDGCKRAVEIAQEMAKAK
eukprot:gene7873-1083_t